MVIIISINKEKLKIWKISINEETKKLYAGVEVAQGNGPTEIGAIAGEYSLLTFGEYQKQMQWKAFYNHTPLDEVMTEIIRRVDDMQKFKMICKSLK